MPPKLPGESTRLSYRRVPFTLGFLGFIAFLAGLLVVQASPTPVVQSSSSPWQLKLDAISKLEQISTTDKNVQKIVDDAIEAVSRSLSDKGQDLFLDESRLVPPPDGKKVFDHEKKAVNHLLKGMKGDDNDDDNGRDFPEKIQAIFQRVIDDLVEADRKIAELSIITAERLVQVGEGNAKKLADAHREFDRALDEDDPKQAIDRFKKAWEFSQDVVDDKELVIRSFEDAPDPFSPRVATSTLTIIFQVLKDTDNDEDDEDEDDEDDGDKEFILEVVEVIQDSSDSIVQTLVTEQEVTVPPQGLNVTITSFWDGLNSDGESVPDGIYSYIAFGKLIKANSDDEDGDDGDNGDDDEDDGDDDEDDDKEKDKVKATSFPVLGTILLDNTPPTIEILSPEDGAEFSVPLATVTGTVSDLLSGVADVTCNGIPALVSDSTFTCDVPLVEGENLVTAEATDLADNANSSSITVNFVPIPEVNITSPANLSFTGSSPISVSGTVDESAVSVEVNGVPATLDTGTFAAEVPLKEGNNIITAVARNSLGNAGTDSIQVTLDTTPPRVTIDSPPDGFVTNTPSVTVSGMINDIVVGTVNGEQAQVTVNGIAAAVANRSFLAADIPLIPGSNTITAVGTDKAGNTASVSITVVFEEIISERRISLVSGNNQVGTIGSQLTEPLVAALTDQDGNPVQNETVIFKVVQNNGTLSNSPDERRSLAIQTDANGKAQVNWKLGTRAGAGNNKVEAASVGFKRKAIFTATALSAAPDKINVDAGNNQTGVVEQPLPKPFIAVVTDAGHNRLGNVPVTFTVVNGGGNFNGEPSITLNTDSDGRALAVLTIGPEEGFDNNVVEATFQDNPGFPATFVASGKEAGDPDDTRVVGVVLDNQDIPIAGVTMRIEGTGLETQTDEQGQFVLQPAPVGHILLIADGSTAQRPGTWPTLEYDLVTVSGQDNDIGMPIYLLPLDIPNGLFVDENTGGTLTLPDIPGFSLTIGPGSATFPNGSKNGVVSVTVVHSDKVPMTPNFGQQPRFITTIQPAGVLFDPPAPITIPNVDGLAPGEVTELYSFDHDLGQFVTIGTGTVSEDGTVIASDPGVGILKGGWNCAGNPSPTGQCQNCQISLQVSGQSPIGPSQSTATLVDLTDSISFSQEASALNSSLKSDEIYALNINNRGTASLLDPALMNGDLPEIERSYATLRTLGGPITVTAIGNASSYNFSVTTFGNIGVNIGPTSVTLTGSGLATVTATHPSGCQASTTLNLDEDECAQLHADVAMLQGEINTKNAQLAQLEAELQVLQNNRDVCNIERALLIQKQIEEVIIIAQLAIVRAELIVLRAELVIKESLGLDTSQLKFKIASLGLAEMQLEEDLAATQSNIDAINNKLAFLGCDDIDQRVQMLEQEIQQVKNEIEFRQSVIAQKKARAAQLGCPIP